MTARNYDIRQLEPVALWNNFADLNQVPRGSKKEEKVIAFIRHFGERLGLTTVVDGAGNVIIKKPATAGWEKRPTLILQAHLDMVHQKNASTDFDFDKEGIRSYIDGDWVKAEGTTLGADNGIGAAAIMTLLASKDIPHPPLEALFTIDEETGMTGAKGLQEGLLSGHILLNLDSEDDDELTIGCAGGLDTYSKMTYLEDVAPGHSQAFKLSVKGLKGGHSGLDIHLGKGNANKIMVRLLFGAYSAFGARLAWMDGGGLRNAIPRECFAVVVVPNDQVTAFETATGELIADIRREFARVEPNLAIAVEPTDMPAKVADPADQEKMLQALYLVPNGVFRMSPEIPGLVETSNNLARVEIRDGLFKTQSLQRSSIESGKADIAHAVRAAFEVMGAEVEQTGGYPGWAPNPDSQVLKVMVDLYASLYGDKPHVAACHAGLECGIIGTHYPGLDMISFGPTIRNPHSPDEMVNIPSVGKFWQYLLAALDRIR